MRPDPRRTDAINTLSSELAREERSRSSRRLVGIAVGLVMVGLVLIGGVVALASRKPTPPLSAAATTAAPSSAAKALASTREVVSADPVVRGSVQEPPVDSAAPGPKPKPKPKPKPNPTSTTSRTAPVAKRAEQRVAIAIGAAGYAPSRLVVHAGAPVVLTVGKGEGCAAGFELPSLGLHLDNSAGPVTKRLGALKPGTYKFSCSMGMVSGVLVAR
jgi:hypothetical protein